MKLFAGRRGVWYDSKRGKIYCRRAPVHGIEQRLFLALCQMVDANGFSIVLSSVDTGKHVPTSRHYSGRAADISDIHVYGHAPEAATLANPHAVAAVDWLIADGFVPAHERPPHDAVLFGPIATKYNATPEDHSDHVHASIYS